MDTRWILLTLSLLLCATPALAQTRERAAGLTAPAPTDPGMAAYASAPHANTESAEEEEDTLEPDWAAMPRRDSVLAGVFWALTKAIAVAYVRGIGCIDNGCPRRSR